MSEKPRQSRLDLRVALKMCLTHTNLNGVPQQNLLYNNNAEFHPNSFISFGYKIGEKNKR
jgi:hypothetical protein